MKKLLAVLAFLLGASAAQAACVPSSATAGMMGCEPVVSSMATTDYLQIWQPGPFPASANLISLSSLLTSGGGPFLPLAGGTLSGSVTGPDATVWSAAGIGGKAGSGGATGSLIVNHGGTGGVNGFGGSLTIGGGAGVGAAGHGGSLTLQSGITAANSRAASIVLSPPGYGSNTNGASISLTAGSPTGSGSVGTVSFFSPLFATSSIGFNYSQTSATASTLGWLIGSQTFAGTVASTTFAPMNLIQIYDDLAVTQSGATGEGLYVQLNTGGAAVTGARNSVQADMAITAATGNTSGQYSAVQGNAFLASSVTDTGSIVYGANFTSQLFPSASVGSGGQVVGQENDVGVQTGATAPSIVTGMQVVPFGNWAVAGASGRDAAYMVGMQNGTVGFDIGYGIAGTGSSNFPIKSTGTLFKTIQNGTVGSGVDISSLTISNYAFKSTGFSVDGSGNVSAEGVTAGGVVLLHSYTVGTLPACNSGTKGGMAYVTDANSPTYNGTLTGGSNVVVPVFCNGAAWTPH